MIDRVGQAQILQSFRPLRPGNGGDDFGTVSVCELNDGHTQATGAALDKYGFASPQLFAREQAMVSGRRCGKQRMAAIIAAAL